MAEKAAYSLQDHGNKCCNIIMQYVRGLKESEVELSPFQPFRLAGRDFLQAEQVGLHYHRAVEIDLFLAARATVRVAGRSLELAGDQVLVIPAGAAHAFRIEAGGRVVVVHLAIEEFSRVFGLEYQEKLHLSDHSWIEALPLQHPDYASLPEPIAVLMAGRTGYIDPLCRIVEILGLAGRGRHLDPGANDHMRRIIEFSEANYRQAITLDEVAAVACISVPHLCRVFKQAAGTSYVDYLSRLRVEKACGLLLTGQPVTEVCYATGFNNLSYFIQVFRRHTGVTPGRYGAP